MTHADYDSGNFDSTSTNQELGGKAEIRTWCRSDNIKRWLSSSILIGEFEMGKAKQVKKKKKQK